MVAVVMVTWQAVQESTLGPSPKCRVLKSWELWGESHALGRWRQSGHGQSDSDV